MYSKVGLLCQLVPSLEMTYVLRELFNIPGGLGRILNIYESMTYRYDQEKKLDILTKFYLLLYRGILHEYMISKFNTRHASFAS